MGASFNTMRLQGTKEEMVRAFQRAQEDDAYSMGHEYSGGWNMAHGISFVDRVFTDEREADEWLSKNAQKWEDALAVRVPVHAEPTAKIKKMEEKIGALQNEVFAFPRTVVARIREQKSKLRTCPKCASKVATDYVRTVACPVCGSDDFGYTETDRKKLERLKEKVKEADAALREEQKKRVVKGPTEWLVGAWLAM